jgi:hypothetical protein
VKFTGLALGRQLDHLVATRQVDGFAHQLHDVKSVSELRCYSAAAPTDEMLSHVTGDEGSRAVRCSPLSKKG